MPPEAKTIQEMIGRLVAGDSHQISFEVGKFGRCDRFVLRRTAPLQKPVEITELATEPGDQTLGVLLFVDGLVETDLQLGVMYNNRRDHHYCLWCRMLDREQWATEPRIAPLYERRMLEQKRICDGTLKRGHIEFGFFPLEGFH